MFSYEFIWPWRCLSPKIFNHKFSFLILNCSNYFLFGECSWFVMLQTLLQVTPFLYVTFSLLAFSYSPVEVFGSAVIFSFITDMSNLCIFSLHFHYRFIYFAHLFKELAFSFTDFPCSFAFHFIGSSACPFSPFQFAWVSLYCFLNLFRRKLRLLTLDICSFVVCKHLIL